MIPAGLADRGELYRAINQELIYAGVPLNPDLRSQVNYAAMTPSRPSAT
jgi:hypothetical protein